MRLPAEGAKVRYRAEDGSGVLLGEGEATTDALGEITVAGLAHGPARVEVAAPGFSGVCSP